MIMTDNNSNSSSNTFPITLKWGKQSYSETIEIGETALQLKQRIQATTGVPVARQKLLAKKGWKSTLKDEVVLDAALLSNATAPLAVTLIGSAETLREPITKTKFIEDLTPQDIQKAEEAEFQEALGKATGMIQGLQLLPQHRDDQKQELYQYNRLVTGLPQRQIEQELQHSEGLQGKIAMNFGLELRRAYVNDLAVLEDGTCVSVLDDGHVQLWKHAAQQEDVVHPGQEGAVNSVVALSGSTFATAGRGTVQVWNSDAEPVVTLPGYMPGTTPASLVSVWDGRDNVTCLAARSLVTRQSDAQQFRLPPQNDSERQRRAQAEAQEQVLQTALARAAKSIWVAVGTTHAWKTQLLEPPSIETAAPISCLARMTLTDGSTILVAGDVGGGLRLWKARRTENGVEFDHHGFFQLTGASCSIVCLEALTEGRLAVSTQAAHSMQEMSGATPVWIGTGRAVHILNFSALNNTLTVLASLTGHQQDAVICMCRLPNGDLLTGGGKMDATLQHWSKSQVEGNVQEVESSPSPSSTPPTIAKAHNILADVGYVFAIAVLPDAKQDSNYYAVAVARYNTVKIII